LALDVKDAHRCPDRGEVKRLDLIHPHLPTNLWHGPRDRDWHTLRVRLQADRAVRLNSWRRLELFARCAYPPVACTVSASPRRLAGRRRCRVVPWPIGLFGRRPPPARVVIGMRACIPAIRGHVDAAAECNRVIDHRDLLMVSRARRMCMVQPEMHPRTHDPV